MDDLLFLVHRIPYPPNKGDKIRAFHILDFLRRHYRVHLGCFVDDSSDYQHMPALRALCASSHFEPLHPSLARLRSMRGLGTGEALSLPYYRSPDMAGWVKRTLSRHPVSAALAFSTPMAQYLPPGLHRVLDMVDVDSQKWSAYAASKAWPLSRFYRREASCLLAYERAAARKLDHVTLVSRAEADLFRGLAPESCDKVSWFSNGTDSDYFAPQHALPNPFPPEQIAVVFTGAMDYWPNVDAVRWFADEILPGLLRTHPTLRFHIVGARPDKCVLALQQSPAVQVSGTVPDIRPYLQHARLAVAPLRIARGIQNKVLEAMAMQKAVVVTPQALEGISAVPGQDLLLASDAAQYVRHIERLLNSPQLADSIGISARARILRDYRWQENLKHLAGLLQPQHDSAGLVP
jgi:sugar transferase (PEP-CTERM/EpsH1 system associated)